MRSFFWSVFSCVQSKFSKIPAKKIPYLDSFHAVRPLRILHGSQLYQVNKTRIMTKKGLDWRSVRNQYGGWKCTTKWIYAELTCYSAWPKRNLKLIRWTCGIIVCDCINTNHINHNIFRYNFAPTDISWKCSGNVRILLLIKTAL